MQIIETSDGPMTSDKQIQSHKESRRTVVCFFFFGVLSLIYDEISVIAAEDVLAGIHCCSVHSVACVTHQANCSVGRARRLSYQEGPPDNFALHQRFDNFGFRAAHFWASSWC